MGLGLRIKEKRKKERLSAEDLALKLDLKKDNIYKWERGSKPSDPEDYKKIMEWLENVPRETESNPQPKDLVHALKQNNEDLRTNNQFLQKMLETNLDKLTLAVSTLAGLSKEQISTLVSEATGDISGPFEQLKKKRSGSGSGIRK